MIPSTLFMFLGVETPYTQSSSSLTSILINQQLYKVGRYPLYQLNCSKPWSFSYLCHYRLFIPFY